MIDAGRKSLIILLYLLSAIRYRSSACSFHPAQWYTQHTHRWILLRAA